jgi:hypothetical protein
LDRLRRIEPFQELPPTPRAFFLVLVLGRRLGGGQLWRGRRLARRFLVGLRRVFDHGEAEIGGDAVELLEQLLAGVVVVDLIDLGGLLVAVEPVEHFEERGDRFDIPALDRHGRDPHRRPQAGKLQLGVVVVLVGEALGERLAHDLADALGRYPLLLGDLVVGRALAQAGEYARPSLHARKRGERPPFRGGTSFVFHVCLAFRPRLGGHWN